MKTARSAKLVKIATARSFTRKLSSQPKIVWTYTDEAPALATFALLPVVQRFCGPAGLAVEVATRTQEHGGRDVLGRPGGWKSSRVSWGCYGRQDDLVTYPF